MEKLSGYNQDSAVVEYCPLCKFSLCEGDECYYINGDYYCTKCIDDAKVTLDKKEYGYYGVDLDE